ncbi:putative tyrosine carboxypeptidase MATCAP2 [Ambystoma mexicanum]|uniref:putative tyrosine carboxypeptidase MATCAP2 n=1 Tax=Ambystoma mexicanum TaxID=8296 RepID=UPI0037E77B5C
MLESIRVTEKLHWPKKELSRKSVLSPEIDLCLKVERHLHLLSSTGVLKDIFTTGTSSDNVFLQSKEEKKYHGQKQSSCTHHKRQRKSTKGSSKSKERRKIKAPSLLLSSTWYCNSKPSPLYITSPVTKLSQSIAIAGNRVGLSARTKTKSKRQYFSSLPKPSPPPASKSQAKEGKVCILNAIRPSNLEKEKIKFFKSDFTYNPMFEYSNPALPNVLAKYSRASDRFLKQAINIMDRALEKYGSYETFEQTTGGNLLPKPRIWYQVRKYMEKEGCLGEIVVQLSEDLLSRASMTVVNGRPTLTINVSTAREHWLEGMLRHEIGTHYFRGMNNSQQPWSNGNGRKIFGLKPLNPTEEGLASIHSVLFRKDPFLWRAALLYYTVYQASRMSFSELFQDVGKFVKDQNTRWDYCVRAKRGWTDTSQPGCFSKDQVYLNGILQILRHRETIDFSLLTALGKISYEDVDRLKPHGMVQNARIPYFLQDRTRYMQYLQKIMEVNDLSDAELQEIVF